MAQPVWITPAGNLGVIPEGVFFQLALEATETGQGSISFALIAGNLPEGIQLNPTGSITGVPVAATRIQGVPSAVSTDVTSKFTIRASSQDLPPRVRDRTFEITITGDDVPEFTTPAGSLGSYYDGDQLNIQIGYTDTDAADTVVVRLVNGELPAGVTVSKTGLIAGYIQPAPDVNEPAGYDLTPVNTLPYDFLIRAINKNYQFTLEVTDGRSSSLRTFEFFVYDRNTVSADTTAITADNSFVTADETTQRRPFIINAEPSNLGLIRGDNDYAYQFIGNDYDTPDLRYSIAVNQGSGEPPGLVLDPITGWYHGTIPDQGVTEIDYSFNIVVYQADFANPTIPILATEAGTNYITGQGSGMLLLQQPLTFSNSVGGLVAGTTYTVDQIISNDPEENTVVFTVADSPALTTVSTVISASLVTECTGTIAGTNRIICNSTDLLGIGQPVVFTGELAGGVKSGTVYYILALGPGPLRATQFTITDRLGSNTAVTLASASDVSMIVNLVVASDPYPFELTIAGDIDAEVTWLTNSNLGVLDNGDTSLLKVEAVNRGGRDLLYRLESGAFNELPQGLELLPTGEISGRVSFNTFAIDLGHTTFDQDTTWDSTYRFTVNAYAQDTEQLLYNVESVTVVNGGTGYSSINPPVIEFSLPVGASAFPAQAGNVTVVDGAITAVALLSPGEGYSAPANVTITQGFGGTDAVLEAVMRPTGIKDVVSVFKEFTVRVRREYNKPYQNLEVQAMPPANDRVLIAELLDNNDIFVPDYIFRPTDPFFGKAERVVYQHAFGLDPDTQDRYVESLYLNHYWKELVLGSIETAQALDEAGNVIYEVVYSRVIDDLVNPQGQSVSKIVNLAYPIADLENTQVAYPNSLNNMRDQVIDVVGQLSTKLPLWMTSKQADGRVLGFTPAWVICYVKPGRARQIAYYISTLFEKQLNLVDFKVDRYVLDTELSRNWDTETQRWTPQSSLTTFDRFSTSGNNFIGEVDIATDLAYSDVNNRTLAYINALGGLDGVVSGVNGNTLIFVKQQDYNGPPGSSYNTATNAWQKYLYPYDSVGYDADGTVFDEAVTIPNGTLITCTNTTAGSNNITCNSTAGLLVGQKISFVGSEDPEDVFGNIVANTVYFVRQIVNATTFKISATASGSVFVLTTASGAMNGRPNNQRMGIYTITIDPLTNLVNLTLTETTEPNDFVQVIRGSFYRSAQLRYPSSPGEGLTEISWLPLETVVTAETFFDEGSVAFTEPVDMYDPTDAYDKYLVFPKANILA